MSDVCNPDNCSTIGVLQLKIDGLMDKLGQRVRWVSVKDRLPEIKRVCGDFDIDHSEEVIILFNGEIVTGTSLYKDEVGYCFMGEHDEQFTLDEITHWMPLPEPPKGEE